MGARSMALKARSFPASWSRKTQGLSAKGMNQKMVRKKMGMDSKEINYISRGGYEKLSKEYDHLKLKERPEILKVIAWAAGNGDRSENADYLYGKKRLREIDHRLRKLSRSLEHAQIVEYLALATTEVRFGATVILQDEAGLEKKCTIVGVDEIGENRISWKSPLGRALIGKKKDDEISVQTPQGIAMYVLIDVQYSKWDNGDL
jgi:transcription elongation factor GreB